MARAFLHHHHQHHNRTFEWGYGGGRTREPRGARTTIEQAVEAYLRAQPARSRSEARFGLELLTGYLNSYGHQSLDPANARLFERWYNAEGAAHREYCQVFGVDGVVPELRQFLSWFMIRKVMAGPGDLRRIAAETGRFVTWLGEHGHVPVEVAAEGAKLAAEAAELLPRAEAEADVLRPRLDAPERGDVLEGHFLVTRLAPGRVWLESEEGGRVYGPLEVPAGVSEGLAVGWQVSGAVGKVRKKWELVEVWNVYPELGA